MAELLAWIARHLVDDPDAVEVESVERDDVLVLRLHVAPDDVGQGDRSPGAHRSRAAHARAGERRAGRPARRAGDRRLTARRDARAGRTGRPPARARRRVRRRAGERRPGPVRGRRRAPRRRRSRRRSPCRVGSGAAGTRSGSIAPVERGAALTVLRSQLPALPEGEFYAFEIIGLRVEEVGGQVVSESCRIVLPGPANDNLELDDGTLVPMIEDAIAVDRPDRGRRASQPGLHRLTDTLPRCVSTSSPRFRMPSAG